MNGHEILGNIAMRMTHTVGNFGLIIVEEGHQGDEMFFIETGVSELPTLPPLAKGACTINRPLTTMHD